jgi:outer membrane protein assembly factor BamB
VDPRGELFVALAEGSALRKLRARDGHTVWSRSLGDRDRVAAIAADASGDLYAAGLTSTEDGRTRPAVTRLDGLDGAVRWSWHAGGTGGGAFALAFDRGDVIAAGGSPSGSSRFTVQRLDGESGRERWRSLLDGLVGLAVRVDGEGDVIAAGAGQAGFFVAKLAGRTGSMRWQYTLAGSLREGVRGEVRALALADGGDVFAAGFVPGGGGRRSFAVVRLSGRDGSEIWARQLGEADAHAGAFAITLDASGNAIAAGLLGDLEGRSEAAVVKLRRRSGSER